MNGQELADNNWANDCDRSKTARSTLNWGLKKLCLKKGQRLKFTKIFLSKIDTPTKVSFQLTLWLLVTKIINKIDELKNKFYFLILKLINQNLKLSNC